VSAGSDPTAIDIRFDPTAQRMSGVALHGNTPFDVPFISQIEGNLWQGGCEDSLVLPTFIEHVISLYPWERYRLTRPLKSMLAVTMYDRDDQAMDQVDSIARWTAACVLDGPTLVHCQAGLNRSGVIAARVLMLGGATADKAIALIRARRSPACLCNSAFEQWLRSIGDGSDMVS
jgi:protein-tyrosine phosphatase